MAPAAKSQRRLATARLESKPALIGTTAGTSFDNPHEHWGSRAEADVQSADRRASLGVFEVLELNER